MSDQAPPIQQGDTTAGPGGAPALPYGEAAQLNTDLQAAAQADQAQPEATAPPEAPAGAQAPEGQATPLPPDLGAAGPIPNFTPTTDEEKWLFGPTANPNEPVTAGLLQSGQIAPPPGLKEWLPSLQAAAADPTAPESTRLILAYVANEMG